MKRLIVSTKKINYKSRSFLRELKRIEINYKLRRARRDSDRKKGLDSYD